MKTRLLICLVVLGTTSVFKKAVANPGTHLTGCHLSARKTVVPGNHLAGNNASWYLGVSNKSTVLDSITKLLRLKLIIDKYNYDDILIAFNKGASQSYDFNEDSRYLPGINAPEGLASYSSDGVSLSQNFMPWPTQAAEVIRLEVDAQSSGPFILKRTQLDSIPKTYGIWLVDNYKKDSLDLRVDSVYNFKIDKADTSSYGDYRFQVVVRITQPLVPALKLVDFTGEKASDGAQFTWVTENETNQTQFVVERTNEGSTAFADIDILTSSGIGTYTFLDKNPPDGTVEYRLKMVDVKGAISYSDIITLSYTNTTSVTNAVVAIPRINIYPNPSSGVINLSINSNARTLTDFSSAQYSHLSVPLAGSTNTHISSYTIKIININGYVVKTGASSSDDWQDNVGNLAPGTYIVQVLNNANNNIVGRSTFIKL